VPSAPLRCLSLSAQAGASAFALLLGLAGALGADRSLAQAASAGPVASSPAASAPRPRIGLVLGGGGARGAAHVGVLEVLDRLRVPVDCVAGTSMGALVAGAWVAGRTPQSMREELAAADWADMFLDDPPHDQLNVRRKHTLQRVLSGTELGLTPDGVRGPSGVLSGQKIKLFFNRLVFADRGEPQIEALPLPLSIVATDIGSGERVAMREGSLTAAMRASMSVPGLMSPHEHLGRRLVDGGLVDNLPVREVRERCQADVVIAVNVGSPLLPPAQVGSLLTVSAQVVGILTEQNVQASLALLGPRDVYIKPDLTGLTAADFARHAEAADRGREAAELWAQRLAAWSLPPAEYAAWWARMASRVGPVRPIDAVRVAEDSGVTGPRTAAVERHLTQRTGEPLDVAALQRDLGRAYGEGEFESVDYEVVQEGARQVLRVRARPKPWGPDYIRFGLSLQSTLRSGSTYGLRASLQRTQLNDLGGEVVASAELGSTFALALEGHQPLDRQHRWFVEGSVHTTRTDASFFNDDLRLGLFRVGETWSEAALGHHLGLLGRARLGWTARATRYVLDTGVPFFPRGPFRWHGFFADVELEQLDRGVFPRQGWQARIRFVQPAGEGYNRLSFDGRHVWPLGEYVLTARVAASGSPRGRAPFHDAALLGGYLNLSGFSAGQLRGDDMQFGQLRAEKIVGRMPLGLQGDLRLGVALEAGRLGVRYSEIGRRGWLDSLTLYAGGLTPFGPAFVGVARSSSGASNAYLFLGTP
jgi:NTE family protein